MINYYLEQRNVKFPQLLSMFCEGLNSSPRNQSNWLHQLHPVAGSVWRAIFPMINFPSELQREMRK